MNRIAAAALIATTIIFGGIKDHGFQGLNRETAPTPITTTITR